MAEIVGTKATSLREVVIKVLALFDKRMAAFFFSF
jgi:hypothetical protein